MWDLLSSAPLRNAICDSDVAICHSFRTYLSSPGKVSFCGMLTTIFFFARQRVLALSVMSHFVQLGGSVMDGMKLQSHT